MHPRSRRGGWAAPPPLSKKQKVLSFDRHYNHYRPQRHCTFSILSSPSFPHPLVSLSSRSCIPDIGRARRKCNLLLLFISSLRSSLHLPARLIFFTRDRARKTSISRTSTLPSPLTPLKQAPAYRSSPYAFAPYAARCASSASPCRRNGDTGTGAPYRTPTSDGSSGCSSACKLCRRPDNWNPLGWTNRSRDPCRGPRRIATWSTARSIVARPPPTWDRWCSGPRLEHKIPGFISMCPAETNDRLWGGISLLHFQALEWETRPTVSDRHSPLSA